MGVNYDDKLEKLEWFKLHPQLKPFIGNNYDEYKILQIGESHYIDRTKDDDKFNICYFRDNWWNSSCDDLVKMFDNSSRYNGCWFDTRRVLNNYLAGKDGSYGIFINIVKSFSKVILDREISHITLEDKQLYNNFAFMNFFQMPSLFKGKKYWNSLVQSAKNRELASKVFRKCTEVSIQAVDDVINIIEPNIIIFTSISAMKAYTGLEYENCIGKYKDDERIIYTSHPSAPFSWNRKLKVLDNKTGEQVLEEGLIRLKSHIK